MFWAARNNSGIPKQLAARLTAREGFPPKSEIHDGRSETEKTQCVWKKTRTEKNPKKRRTAGRKPKSDPAVFRYGIKLNSEENGKFELLFERSGLSQRSKFIKSMLFGREIKVVKIDKATMDYYVRLTNFYHQFQAIGNNYNQTVKAVKSNFSDKRALALLYKLEKITMELVVLSRQIIALTREYEEKYLNSNRQSL